MQRQHREFPTVAFGSEMLSKEVARTLGLGTKKLPPESPVYVPQQDCITHGLCSSFEAVRLDPRRIARLKKLLTDHGFAEKDGRLTKIVKVPSHGKFKAEVVIIGQGRLFGAIKTRALYDEPLPGACGNRDLVKHPYTPKELSQAFDLVKPKGDWKGPIRTMVPATTDMQLLRAAILHFTLTHPHFTEQVKGLVGVKAAGRNAAGVLN